jgi:hypothetical protein
MSQDTTNYLITRVAIGKYERISISREIYEEILHASNILGEITNLEEKFFCICENYRHVRTFVFDVTYNNTIYALPTTIEFYLAGLNFNRLLLSLLSSVRLYMDSKISHLQIILDKSVSKTDLKAVASHHYDNLLEYRIMEALRNYSQHQALPINHMSFGSSWDKKMQTLSHSSDFYFNVKNVVDLTKINAKTRSEMLAIDGKIDIKRCLDVYFSAICEIHTEYRKLYKSSRAQSVGVIGNYRKIWQEKSLDPSLLGVAACEFKGPYINKNAKEVWLDPQTDEYRNYLERKTAAMSNMSKRKAEY